MTKAPRAWCLTTAQLQAGVGTGVEVKRGTRVNTERKFFPGYILIKMILNDDTWYIIKKLRVF